MIGFEEFGFKLTICNIIIVLLITMFTIPVCIKEIQIDKCDLGQINTWVYRFIFQFISAFIGSIVIYPFIYIIVNRFNSILNSFISSINFNTI